jgi:hypothetical protein
VLGLELWNQPVKFFGENFGEKFWRKFWRFS